MTCNPLESPKWMIPGAYSISTLCGTNSYPGLPPLACIRKPRSNWPPEPMIRASWRIAWRFGMENRIIQGYPVDKQSHPPKVKKTRTRCRKLLSIKAFRGVGIEPSEKTRHSPEKQQIPVVAQPNAQPRFASDADLALIVKHWQSLAEPIKLAVMALVRTASEQG